MDDNDFVIMDALFAEVKRLNSELQLEDTETKPDGKCREDDGCPTENAVLRREWRKLTEQLAAVTAERDAAREQLCYTCRNGNPSAGTKHSASCDICPWCGQKGDADD